MEGLKNILFFFVVVLYCTAITDIYCPFESSATFCEVHLVSEEQQPSKVLRSDFSVTELFPTSAFPYLVPPKILRTAFEEYINLFESFVKNVIERSATLPHRFAKTKRIAIGNYCKLFGRYYILALRHILI